MRKTVICAYLFLTCLISPSILAGNIMMFGDPESLPEFALLDHNGKPFTKQEMENQWSFLIFGYTSCPDACPTALATLDEFSDLIKNEPDENKISVKTILVSLDPVRDTPQTLKEYIQYFDKDFIALTGIDNTDINRLTFPIGVNYDYEDSKTHEPIQDTSTLSKDREYTVNHFAGIFIVAPLAKVTAIVFPPLDAYQIKRIFTFIRQSNSNKDLKR